MEEAIKLSVDIDKLKGNAIDNYIATEELTDGEERLRGLIENDISFSAIVYGYRGTGKSSFVSHVLKKFEDDRIIIKFNATKYDNQYDKFLKRFIRELYLAVNRNEKIEKATLWTKIGRKKDKKKLIKKYYQKTGYQSEVLRNIYRHTFYNISESVKTENERTRSFSSEMSFSGEGTFERTVDLTTVVAALGVVINKAIIAPLNLSQGKIDVLSIVGGICLVLAANWVIKLVVSLVATAGFSKTHSKKSETVEESLYDDEIAEYHVFSELKKISNENKKVIFVLDELDKLGDESIKTILSDLKALILSEDIISILVAGKNYEEYWDDEKDDTDGIAANLFSQKIYVPLADTMRAREIVKSLFREEDQKKLDDTDYINKKIMKSEGVIRELINLVVSDIKWENKDSKPEATVTIYNNLANTASEVTAQKCYRGLTLVEEAVSERYREGYYAKADEMYKLAYMIARYIRDNKLKLEKESMQKVSSGLKKNIGKNTKHLTKEEKDLVFDRMFSDEVTGGENTSVGDASVRDASEGKVSEENAAEENAPVENENTVETVRTERDLYRESFKILYDSYNEDLSDSEISTLQSYLADMLDIIIYFAKYMKEDVSTIMSMCYNTIVIRYPYDGRWSSYDAFRKISIDNPVSLSHFAITYAESFDIMESRKPRFINVDRIKIDQAVLYRLKVAEAIIKIYSWKELGGKEAPFKESSFTHKSVRSWDIEEYDNGVFRAVDVKYYAKAFVDLASFPEALDSLEMAAYDDLYTACNGVIAVFVPEPVGEVFMQKADVADKVEVVDDEKTVRLSLRYIPYDNYEHFKEGLDSFRESLMYAFPQK